MLAPVGVTHVGVRLVEPAQAAVDHAEEGVRGSAAAVDTRYGMMAGTSPGI